MTAELAVVEEPPEAVATEVHETLAAARAMVVQTPLEAEQAVEVLSRIKKAKAAAEETRLFFTKPLNDQLTRINAKFKELSGPLKDADQIVREKLLSYETEQQEKARVEQERLDRERRELEEAAERERQAKAAEAARIEREEREREQQRQAQLREAANERAREISLLSDGELADMARGTPGEPFSADAELAIKEIGSRHEAEAAQKRAEAARLEAERATAASVAAASAPTVAVVRQKLASASGSASTSKHWVGVVVEPGRVPLEYRPVDQKLINAAVKAGVREIPGVLIEQTSRLAVR